MPRPTKREWIAAYLAGLEKTGYSGRVQLTIEFNNGGISKATTLREEELGPKPYDL